MARAAEAAPVVREMPAVVPGLAVHIDGDMICYECAGNEDVTPGEARQRALNKIGQLQARSGAESVNVHVTSPASHKGHRHGIATVKPYQASRSGKAKPKNHGYLQDFLSGYTGAAFKIKSWADREADDGIAACAYYGITKPPGYIVIATADKDMRMLPGLHVDWKTGELTRVLPGDYDVVGKENGKQYGTKWFWLQMLQGDAADNIPGLPSYYCDKALKPKLLGEKTAEKFLAPCTNNHQAFTEVYGLYCEYYEHLGFTAEEADDRFCEQAALLWMRADLKGSMDNFMRHEGPGSISGSFPNELRVAATRMKQRVEKLYAEAN